MNPTRPKKNQRPNSNKDCCPVKLMMSEVNRVNNTNDTVNIASVNMLSITLLISSSLLAYKL